MDGLRIQSKPITLKEVPSVSWQFSQLDRKTDSLYIPHNIIENMSTKNLFYDEDYDCFVNPNFGAWMTNCSSDIGTLEKLLTHFPEKYEEGIQNGYEIVIGIGAPAPIVARIKSKMIVLPGNGNGVYLKNYREIIDRQINKEEEELAVSGHGLK